VRKCGYVLHSIEGMLIRRWFLICEKYSNNFGYENSCKGEPLGQE